MASRRYEPATWRQPPNADALRGLAAAQAALYDTSAQPLLGDDALAMREQMRRNEQQRAHQQGELRLMHGTAA